MLVFHVLVTCVVLLLQDVPVLSARMKMEPRDISVRPGQNVSILCRADFPLLYCRIQLPGRATALSLSPLTKPNGQYAYHGSGLADGQCGVTLIGVEDKVSGEVECTGAPVAGTEEVSARTSLTVLRSPKAPELAIAPSATTRNAREFREGEVLSASCVVKDGRPVANITWYFGEEVLASASASSETFTDPRTNLHTVRQSVKRKLGWQDDSKELRCVAGHIALGSTINHSGKTLSVIYPPKYLKSPVELYGFVINRTGNVTVQIQANPKPSFLWFIGKSQLPEGQRYPGGNLEAMRAEFLGNGRWNVVLHINKVTKEDIDREYYLRATNAEGHRTYQIVLSADSGPTFAFGMGAIVGIVVVAVIVLAVAISVYVFVSGRRKRMSYSPTSEGLSKVTIDAPLPTAPSNDGV